MGIPAKEETENLPFALCATKKKNALLKSAGKLTFLVVWIFCVPHCT